jgi:hypothetical protein
MNSKLACLFGFHKCKDLRSSSNSSMYPLNLCEICHKIFLQRPEGISTWECLDETKLYYHIHCVNNALYNWSSYVYKLDKRTSVITSTNILFKDWRKKINANSK